MAGSLAGCAHRDRSGGPPARHGPQERLIAIERLDLADWRRRVADLYAGVRAESATDPERAWTSWRRVREELFRDHPQSPVPPADRASFTARHWSYDPRYRLEAVVQAGQGAGADAAGADAAQPSGATKGTEGSAATEAVEAAPLPFAGFLGGLSLTLPVSTGGLEEFTRIGSVAVPLPGGERRLGVYWMAGYAGGIFLPFRDGTNGHETYGAGRYLLDAAKSADLGAGTLPDSLVLDFNFAFQPSCAFDPKWACPLAPPENRLDIRIEAGERLT